MFPTNPPSHRARPRRTTQHAFLPLALITLPAYPDRLPPETVTTIILAFAAVLLTGILIHMVRLRLQLQKQTKALSAREKQLGCLGNDLPQTVLFQLLYQSDRSFKFAFMGEGYKHMLGLDRDALLKDARQVLDQVYEKDLSLLKNAFRSGKEKAESADFELRVLDVNGKLKWLHVCATPRLEQRTLYWDGFFQDITRQKTAQEALLDENHNLQDLFNMMDDFLFVCDMDGQLLHANPAVERRMQYPLDEISEMSIFELFPEDQRDAIYSLIARMQTRETMVSELSLRTRTDEYILSEVHAFRGHWGRESAIYLQAQDITDRKEAETALRESQEVLQLVINSIPMSVYWKDIQSTYHGCNEAFARECGLEDINNIIGKTLHDLFDSDFAREIEEHEQEAIRRNHALSHILKPYTREDGSPGRRESSVLPLHGDNGGAIGILGIWRDVTEHSMAEERLKRMLEDMERFNDLLRSRERRTLELKTEVNELLKKSGEEQRYKTVMEGRS